MGDTTWQLKKFILIIMSIVVVFGVFSSLLIYAKYQPIASDANKLLNYKNEGIIIEDRDGNEIYSTAEKDDWEYVELSKISDEMKEAVLVAEDKGFYRHSGFSITGIMRSIFLNMQQSELMYGGSTITQQLAKNTLLSGEKTISRKYKELLISLLLESRYSKDEILEMYLNTAYFGEGAYGVKSASEKYFNKQPSDLSLFESAYLAGMLSSPSHYNPYTSIENGMDRQKIVLKGMIDSGYVSSEELKSEEDLQFEEKKSPENAEPNSIHFSLYVISLLEDMYGDNLGGDQITVRTTLDSQIQSRTNDAITSQINAISNKNATNGAAVVMDPINGEVLAMVGSVDWGNSEFGKYNMATAPRQVGSAFKPVVYSIALENNTITPSTILHDKPTTFDNPDHRPYKPENYDRRYRGRVLVREALASSLNIPSVEVMEKVGVKSVVGLSDDFGISTISDPSNYGLSLVLGTAEVSLLEMTGAYTTFANKGSRPKVSVIKSVENKFGEIIYKSDHEEMSVISPETAYQITSFLSDENARRRTFGSLLSFPFEVAVKTGTTENFRDAWTIGYNPEFVVGVWVGNNNNEKMMNLSGSQAAAPAFRKIMTFLVNEYKSGEFEKPESIIAVSICRHNGLISTRTSTSSAVIEFFVKGQEPQRHCIVSGSKNDENEENVEKTQVPETSDDIEEDGVEGET